MKGVAITEEEVLDEDWLLRKMAKVDACRVDFGG
jgi:hypothetical protein